MAIVRWADAAQVHATAHSIVNQQATRHGNAARSKAHSRYSTYLYVCSCEWVSETGVLTDAGNALSLWSGKMYVSLVLTPAVQHATPALSLNATYET